jgi:hypothetical protein
VLADYLLARACSSSKEKGSSSEAVALPPVVGKNFSLLMAVRILTFLDSDGYPLVIPLCWRAANSGPPGGMIPGSLKAKSP